MHCLRWLGSSYLVLREEIKLMSIITMPLFLSLLVLSLFSQISSHITYLDKDGAYPECNYPPRTPPYKQLSSIDMDRIKKLIQIHLYGRHGTRVSSTSVSNIFSNTNEYNSPQFQPNCTITSVTTPKFNSKMNYLSTEKVFTANEEMVGGNCNAENTVYQAFAQHKLNAKRIYNYYIGNKKNNIMTKNELKSLKSTLKSDNNLPQIKILSSNFERCIFNVQVLFSHLLSIYDSNINIYVYTHDITSDPLNTDQNYNCPELWHLGQVYGRSTIEFQTFIKSDFSLSVQKQWKEEVDNKPLTFLLAREIVIMYCMGLHIPVSHTLMSKIYAWSQEYQRCLVHNTIGREFCTLANMPFAWILKTLISDRIYFLNHMLDEIDGYMDASEAKIVFYASQGIYTLYMMGAFNIQLSGHEPMFANIIALEIYEKNGLSEYKWDKKHHRDSSSSTSSSSSKHKSTKESVESESEKRRHLLWNKNKSKSKSSSAIFDNYLFRFNINGKFLPFTDCEDEYEHGSQLCSLMVLMNLLNEISMPLNEWEPFCRNITETLLMGNGITSMDVLDTVLVDDHQFVSSVESVSSENYLSRFTDDVWLIIIAFLLGATVVFIVDRWKFIRKYFQNINSVDSNIDFYDHIPCERLLDNEELSEDIKLLGFDDD